MIIYKSLEEIELIRESSLLVAKTLAEVAKVIKPGIKTKDLDIIAETFIRDNNAVPAFKNYHGYPATLCISINEQVVHGIPGNTEIKEGDLVSVDCGAIKNSYFGDSAYTFEIGEVKKELKKLCDITKEALYLGIEKACTGNRLGDIGSTIQQHVENHGFGVVRDLVGHGIGKNLHEKPEVPNYGKRGNGVKINEGLVIAIEPMINLGDYRVIQEKDGWTIKTKDLKPSAHFEHTIAVVNGKPEILSTFKFIEEILKK